MWRFLRSSILMNRLHKPGNASAHTERDASAHTKRDTATFLRNQIKNHPELLPILSIFVYASVLIVYATYHAVTTKSDVRFDRNKRKTIGPHEEIGPTQKTKAYTGNPKDYRPIGELESLKKDLKLEEE